MCVVKSDWCVFCYVVFMMSKFLCWRIVLANVVGFFLFKIVLNLVFLSCVKDFFGLGIGGFVYVGVGLIVLGCDELFMVMLLR